jgi:hypothetical protein
MTELRNDPMPSVQLYVLENRVHTSERIKRNGYIELIKLQRVTFQKFHSPQFCHKFLVLTVYRFLVRGLALQPPFCQQT